MLVNSPTQILFSKIYPAGPQVVPGGRTNERKDRQTKLIITFCTFLYNKTNRSTNFPKFILVRNSTVPLPIIRSYQLFIRHWQWQDGTILILQASCLQTCITCASAEWTVDNSWWWAEELAETCRVSYQNKFGKISASVGFIVNKFVTMHGHMNVKFTFCTLRMHQIKRSSITCTEWTFCLLPIKCPFFLHMLYRQHCNSLLATDPLLYLKALITESVMYGDCLIDLHLG